jgi:hypothetical protein
VIFSAFKKRRSSRTSAKQSKCYGLADSEDEFNAAPAEHDRPVVQNEENGDAKIVEKVLSVKEDAGTELFFVKYKNRYTYHMWLSISRELVRILSSSEMNHCFTERIFIANGHSKAFSRRETNALRQS